MSRYRDDNDDVHETRRGRARSYAEERFYEAQQRARDERGGYESSNDRNVQRDDDTQFNYGPMDRDRQQRDDQVSRGAAPFSPSRDREDYYRPAGRDVGMRYDRQYDQSPDRADDYARRGARDYDRENYADRSSYINDRSDEKTYGTSREVQQRRGSQRSHVRCRDIMTRDITVAQRGTTLFQVAQMMRDEDTGVIPVVEQITDGVAAASQVTPADDERRNERTYGRLVGLITDRDIVVRAIAEGKDANATRAEEIMTEDVHTAAPNDRVIEAIRKMGDKQVRRIPVVDRDGNLRGIISMADVALETEADHELAQALEEISSGASFWSKMFG